MSDSPGDVDELLTVEDVCAWFKVTRSWVYDEVEAGRLPYVRIGRQSLRFHRSELRLFLQARSCQSLQRRPRSPCLPNDGLKPSTEGR
jgi:excisionase family DNA binding protein